MKTANRLLLGLCACTAVMAIAGCGRTEKVVSIKMEQSRLLQEHIASFAAACTGKLSMSTQLTGDIEKPAVTTISCDQMDKKSPFFAEKRTPEETKALEDSIRKLNQ